MKLRKKTIYEMTLSGYQLSVIEDGLKGAFISLDRDSAQKALYSYEPDDFQNLLNEIALLRSQIV